MARKKKGAEPDPAPERPSQPRTQNSADEVDARPETTYVGDLDLESSPHADQIRREGDE